MNVSARCLGLVIGPCLLLFASPRPVSAQIGVGSEDLDRILAALAEVIKDRAKEVAADTLREQLESDLCGNEKTLTLKKGADARPGEVVALKLRFGGSAACRDDDGACTADDVFVGSCRLLSIEDIQVTDPHLLKSIGQDMVSLALRIAAASLAQADYDRLRLRELSRYVFDVMAALKGGHLDQRLIVEKTISFAESLGRNADEAMAATVMEAAGRSPATAAIVAKSYAVWKEHCPGAGSAACEYVKAFPPAPPAGTFAPTPADCSKLANEAAHRAEIFKRLFDDEGPFQKAYGASCSSAHLGAPCKVAQIGRLLDAVYPTACRERPATSGDLRHLTYVLFRERAQYEDALGIKDADTSELKKLADALAPELRAAGGAALATILRVVTSGLRAQQADAKSTTAFLDSLAGDLSDVRAKGYLAILDGDALGWARRDGLKTAELRVFRDAVKNLVALPVFVLGVESVPVGQVEASVRLVNDIVVAMKKLTTSQDSAEGVVRDAADLVGLIGRAVKDVVNQIRRDPALPAANAAADDVVKVAALLGSSARFLGLAADRDWMGIALGASLDVASGSAANFKQPEVVRSFAFLRMMMSVYQAETKDEAKAIFEAALVQKGSRRERFVSFAVDVAALVGARFGWQTERVTDAAGARTWQNETMGGFYAPVGLQLGYGHLGLLIYPIDLGAYLVATSGDSKVNSWDAIRPGGALMVRFAARYPVDLLVNADYGPAISDQNPQWRFGASLALELPLYQIH